MINYLILEDEPIAARRLQRLLGDIRPDWQCIGKADSLRSGVDLLQKSEYHLVFSDIELSDCSAFEIFQESTPKAPIIFVTAFDQYALRVFDFNSVHYLLKPLNANALNAAIAKFETNPAYIGRDLPLFQTQREQLAYKLISRVGNRSTVINHTDLAYVYYSDRMTTAYLTTGESHLLDQSLDALVEYLPGEAFYRINRQCIVAKTAICGYSPATSSRLSLKLNSTSHTELIVSKENVKPFKDWLGAK